MATSVSSFVFVCSRKTWPFPGELNALDSGQDLRKCLQKLRVEWEHWRYELWRSFVDQEGQYKQYLGVNWGLMVGDWVSVDSNSKDRKDNVSGKGRAIGKLKAHYDTPHMVLESINEGAIFLYSTPGR